MRGIFKRKPSNTEPQTTGTIFDDSDGTSDWMGNETPAPTSSRKSRKSGQEARQNILDYLREHQGEVVKSTTMAQELGYQSPSPVDRMVRELIQRGTVTRKGTRQSYTYRVNRKSVNRRRKANRPTVSATKAKKKVEKKVTLPEVGSKTPKLRENARKVFDFISRHPGQLFTNAEIGQRINMAGPTVNYQIKTLHKQRLIEVSGFKPGEGTAYRIAGESATPEEAGSPNSHSKAERPTIDLGTKNNEQFVNVVESLIWEYIRATRTTDLLKFLTWLERKVK